MGGKSTTSTQTVSIPPEVMARYNAVNARAENVAATPFQPYGGQFVAPLSPTQQAGVQATNQYSQTAQPYYGAATGLTLAGAQDVGPLTGGQIGRYMDPYVGTVLQPTLQALQQQQGQERSKLMGQQAASGAFGGDRAGLERANLARQQELATGQVIAPLLSQAYGQAVQTATGQQGVAAQDLARRMQAGQALAGLGQAQQQTALQGAQAQLQAGGLEQQTQQADLTARYQQFLQERGYPFQVAQFLANIAMGTGALSGSTTTTEQPSGLFSDKRLKHDAKRIGETDDGLPIYTYKYNGDDKTHMGVFAQDAEKKHKDAVGLAPAADGQMYKTVDYEKLHDRDERAYGGGLDVNSMGGAVMEPGEFSRGGYALGGGMISDTEMKSMMANMKQPLGMYQSAGLYGGTPFSTPYGPGLGIRGDAVPVPSLVTAVSLKSPPPSALQQATSAYKQVSDLGQMGSGLYDFGERIAVGRPEQKDDKGKIIQQASSGFLGTKGEYDPSKGWLSKFKSEEQQGAARGGLIGREHYNTRGGVPGGSDLPYGAGQEGYDPLAEIIKQGQQQHYSLPKPGELPKRQEPLKDVMQTGMQMYSAGKMGSNIIDKGKALVDKMTSESMAPATGQVQTDITAMPVARPPGLGAATVNPDAPAAGSKAIEATQGAVNPAGTYTIPGTSQTITASGAESPTSAIAETIPETSSVAAAPVAETAAAAAPEALGAAGTEALGAGLGAAGAEAAGAGLAAAGTEAAGAGLAAGAEEVLPFLLMLLKRGGRANAHHYADGGLVPRQGYANEGSVDSAEPDYRTMAIDAAKKANIDPDHFVRLIQGESGFKLIPGDDGSSAGHLQMHVGNVSEKYPNPGLGNAVMRDLYPELDKKLSPAEKVAFLNRAENQKDQYEYAAQHIANNGAGAWTQARVQGLFGLKPTASAPSGKSLGDVVSSVMPSGGLLPTKKDSSGAETTDWKRILVPLATGIAGVASAPTRNLGTALAMGLGAGAQSYANLDKQMVEQELKAREVATGEKRASIEDATRRMQLLNQLRQLAAGLAKSGQPIPPYLNDQINELTRSLTTSTGSPELAGAAKAGQTTLAGPQKAAAAGTPPAAAAQPSEKVVESAPAAQDQKTVENIQKGPAPTQPPQPELTNSFLSQLDPNSNPKILRERAKTADVLSPGAGDQLMKDAQILEDKIFEKGYGVGPKGERVDVPGWGEYKNAVANMPKLKEFLDSQRETAMARTEAQQRQDNIKKIFETFQPGKFAEQKAEFQAAVRALGFNFDDTATINSEKVQELAKEATRMTFEQVKAIGGQPRVIEFQMNKMANPESTLQPGSARRIVAEGDALLAWNNKYYNDLNKAYEEQGWKFDPNKFTNEWLKKEENNRAKFSETFDKNTAVRGDTPRENDGRVNSDKLKDGYTYIIEPGMGVPIADQSGSPMRLRWNSSKNRFERP